jgi:hypothetical protein
MVLLLPALESSAEVLPDFVARDGGGRNYYVIEQISGDFLGDGRETPIELVLADDNYWPNYFWRLTPQGAREPKYYPLALYTTIGGMKPLVKTNDIDGDGIPEIFARYHAGGTGGLEFEVCSFKGENPRRLCTTLDGFGINIEHPDIDFELMDGFNIKATYAGKETVYKITAASLAGHFFMPDGTINEGAILDIHLTSKFLDIDLADIDGDGISEIKGSLIIGGAATNASYFGDVDVTYVWKDDEFRIRDVNIRFAE